MALVDIMLKRLERSADIGATDRALLTSLKIEARQLAAREEVATQGSRPTHSVLLIQGVLARYQEMADGKRQTVSYHLPGEVPDLHSLFIHRMDHTLGAVTEALVGAIAHHDLRRVFAQSPDLAGALWRETLIDAAIFRQWITNNGQRGSTAGMAHLLCELFVRAHAIGQAKDDGRWDIPFTQAQLGDALGITAIHANRILRKLAGEGAVLIENGVLQILDWAELKAVAGFDPVYLHLKDPWDGPKGGSR